MIDFKKRLKKKPEEDPAQTLLPLKPREPDQAEMLVCQICGRTWKCETAEQSRKFWKNHGGPGPMCQCCWTLYSLMAHSQAQKMSLRTAVKKFVTGYAKRKHVPFEKVWESKSAI